MSQNFQEEHSHPSISFMDVLIMITIFLNSIVFFKEPFEGYISYFVMLALVPGFLMNYGISRDLLVVMGILFITGITQVFLGNNEFGAFLKIFLGVGMSYLFFYQVVHYYDLDIKNIMKIYMKGAFVVALLGVFQLVSFQIGFESGYTFGGILNKWSIQHTQTGGFRLNSIFSEPSQFGLTMAPAMFVSLLNLITGSSRFVGKIASGVILFTYMLTFSTVAYVGVILALFLIFYNYFNFLYVLIPLPLVFLFAIVLYNNIPGFRDRIDSSLELFTDGEFRGYSINQSSFVQYNNFHVAKENFKEHPIAGSGLGSHQYAFEKHTLTRFVGVLPVEFNKQDANSMFLRIMSETGLLGIGFILFFLFRFFVKKGEGDEIFWIVSNATLVIILLYLLRQGHYFLNGFPIFMWMYYYSWKNKMEAEEVEEEEVTAEGEEENEEISKSPGGIPAPGKY